ncbi:MAG: hypothetical protein J6B81_05820 [Spirochaetaceae bacterium]|nr:hypothetical protein [Spirochaetaceae bacterium]
MLKHNRASFLVLFALLLIVLLFFGCATTPPAQQDSFLFSLLPRDSQFYLRFPVQDNMDLANSLVTSFAPNLSEKDKQKLLDRIGTIYGSILNDEIYAASTGSFPKFALGFVLKEKNGWQKVRSKNIPITEKYYVAMESGLQLAFPNSSVALAANDVVSMLQSYQNYESSHVQESSASLFFLQQEQENPSCISFYLIDAGNLLPSLKGSSFKLSFPFGDGYGYLTPDLRFSHGGVAYQLEAFLSLTDSRALRPAIAALKIASRAIDVPFQVEAYGSDVIRIYDMSFTKEMLCQLVLKILEE